REAGTGDAPALFDGTSLGKWTSVEFGGEGKVHVQDGAIVLEEGVALTGVAWSGEALPKANYELSLEARKIDGQDFFCGIAFPVGSKACSFVAGGWGGHVIGLSSIDGMNASENETTSTQDFERGRWYKIRLRVEPETIKAWIDGKEVINVSIKGRDVSIHPAMESALPLGLTAYATKAAFRDIRIKKL
ncbi:MAG TPA: DUF1080 domain-containing protein, partial [Planctomycetota bacterium]|nr:DUF1080 domain-containing protein [Planctomycetota bacterium]